MSTTLASGANTTITLPAGQVLYTGKTGNGTAVIGPGPQANQTFTLGTGARIGPYGNDVSVFLTSTQGAIDYQVGSAPGVPSGVPVAIDPLGPAISSPDAAGAVQRKPTTLNLSGSAVDRFLVEAYGRGQLRKTLYADTLSAVGVAPPISDRPTVATGTGEPTANRFNMHGSPDIADGLTLSPAQKSAMGQYIFGGNPALRWLAVTANLVHVPSTVVLAATNSQGTAFDTNVGYGVMALDVFGAWVVPGTFFAIECTNGSEFQIFIGPKKEFRVTGTPGASGGGTWSSDGSTYRVGTTTSGIASLTLTFPSDVERVVWLVPGNQDINTSGTPGGANRTSPGGWWGTVFAQVGKTIRPHPTLPSAPKIQMPADSYGLKVPDRTIPMRVMQEFNNEVVVINSAVASSGFVAGTGPNSSTSTPGVSPITGQFANICQRTSIDIVAGSGADLTVVGPVGINDGANVTTSAANAVATVSAILQQRPGQPVYYAGANASLDGLNRDLPVPMESALIAALQPIGVTPIPFQTDPDGPLMSGNCYDTTNGLYEITNGAIRSVGTSANYIDAAETPNRVHLVDAGNKAFAARIAAGIAAGARKRTGQFLA